MHIFKLYHPVKAWLLERGLTLVWLRGMTGIHDVTLSQYLSDEPKKRRTFAKGHVDLIARALEVDALYVSGPSRAVGIAIPIPAKE